MIVYDLQCEHSHRFEGWFGSSSDFEAQLERGLVSCPECGSDTVIKAPMAPAVPAKGNSRDVTAPSNPAPAGQAIAHPEPVQVVSNEPIPAEMEKALKALAKAQEKALKNSTWVGDKFAEKSREMHYGESEQTPIHGKASLEEAKSLIDEGVAVAPLPFPVAPPDELN
ncbi:DUF1178 family protein [Erythrobacter sp. YT30]|uniref:DUF1178 family protein n=1 Tax=Erythrobacter sp. YT30 TaxID=1735012 RepID=UPI00076BFE18|nr:DUF1178 family protein [Erythrobacter sp. YT30]KWV93464.1 hypothetical protein AUC45_02455 [Erythrobacter sp. YT30]